ncbi:NYN domain-containing protein [Clostridium sediminicola]|uniref:NYN domain-containing protein n=1 Tax=Clostridium sediminicola TaxID=3114879 RepID=UPI0031F220C7
MKYIFIDGYNVINSWPELKNIKEFSFESGRESLVEMLQDYASYKGYKLVLVFDAHLVNGSLEKIEKLGNVDIVFTKEGETADSFIERYVDSIGRKSDVSVVTSDSLEQQLIFQRGAARMSSMEFYHEVHETKKKIRKKTAKKQSGMKNFLHDYVDDKTMKELEKIRRGE